MRTALNDSSVLLFYLTALMVCDCSFVVSIYQLITHALICINVANFDVDLK